MKMGTHWQHGPGHVSIEYNPHGHLVLEKKSFEREREVLYPRDVQVAVV